MDPLPPCEFAARRHDQHHYSYNSHMHQHGRRHQQQSFTGKQHVSFLPRPWHTGASQVHLDHLKSCCSLNSVDSPPRAAIPIRSCTMGSRRPSPSRRRRTRTHTMPTTSRALLTLLGASLAAPMASGARIPFTNCLPDEYKLHKPQPLQWEPLYADATFDIDSDRHTLLVKVWGNVTGSQNDGELPPPSSNYWKDDDETNGKITETDNPDQEGAYATTLFRKVNVLTYLPVNTRTAFCHGGLINSSCPLSPVFITDGLDIPYDLPAINMTHDFFSSYAFTSFTPTFIVTQGNKAGTHIACISATITPSLGSLAALLKFLPLVVLVLSGLAVIFAGIFSPWGTTDILHWTSNYGRDVDLLRLVTPGFGDCLQYIQYIALTGALTLSYPGFYQPITSQVAWSSLIFDEEFVTNAERWDSIVDGIYVTNGTYGIQRYVQLVGLAKSQDLWAGMIVYLAIIAAGVFILVQAGFLGQWLYRRLNKIPEEDLRAKNIPFTIGNIVRIVFNFFLLPFVALSTYQFVIAGQSPAYVVALAAVILALVLGSAGWILSIVIRARPKSVLFDDLPTLLQYGPLYNTYSDEVSAYAVIPILLNIIRGIAIGAVQPSGIAQVVLLAICEVIQILSLQAFRPYLPQTSMNAYHTFFSSFRLISIMLMVAFVPSLGVTDGPKGWIGYAILVVHGIVLLFGFLLNVLQTVVEVVARMLGAGGDDVSGLTRGGLSKIFGMRQLSKRTTPRPGPSRASQLSTSAMLDAEDGAKTGYAMSGGRLRSESAASMGGGLAMGRRHRSSSAFDSIDMYSAGHRQVDSASSYVPGTPTGGSTFSFIPSLTSRPQAFVQGEPADPYYRPPRARRETLSESVHSDRPRGSLALDTNALNPPSGQAPNPAETGAEISRGATPAPPGGGNLASNLPPSRPDYATREVDFYYGVRGPALNSDGPGRKLGTGPADPTGPVATATGWFRNMFGGKTKEKGKGFEVVRSARMQPSQMGRNGAFGDETPPEGIPVALGTVRKGPIDSDDEDDTNPRKSPRHREGDLLTDDGDPQGSDGEPDSPITERLPRGKHTRTPGSGSQDMLSSPPKLEVPGLPRTRSRRDSTFMDSSNSPSLRPVDSRSRTPNHNEQGTETTDRLPFQRTPSQQQLSENSSMELHEGLTDVELQSPQDERPASFGVVPQHGISRVDTQANSVDLLGSSAELVDEGNTNKHSQH